MPGYMVGEWHAPVDKPIFKCLCHIGRIFVSRNGPRPCNMMVGNSSIVIRLSMPSNVNSCHVVLSILEPNHTITKARFLLREYHHAEEVAA